MDPPVSDLDKINDHKEGGPSFHCDLYDTQVVHKISLVFLPGLATACVDNTTGDLFKTPGSVAAEIKKEMIEYLNQRSESFVAEHIVLQGGSEIEASHDPYDIVSDFVDDFATSKRNLFSRVSGWLLSERREDNIDDFAQEMEISGFWLTDHIEGIAQTLLKNVDFKSVSHCEMKFQTQGELAEHVLSCGYRTMNCENEGCNAVFCANQMENHDSVCPFKIIPCEQNCSESIMRREMDRHCITVCRMKLVNCPFHAVGCLADVHQCEIQQHHLDNVSSHLMCVLKSIYKEASLDDLKPRAEQIQQLSTRLSEARNARALTNLVKEIDAKLGALVIKPKNVTDVESDKPDNAEKKAEIKEKAETDGSLEQTASEKTPEDEVVSREADVLVDDAKVDEVVKKVSEAEIAENVNEQGESKAQKLLEMDEFIKEGDDSSAADLSERTETKAPEVVVMDEDKEEEKSPQTRTNETRGVETEVNDMIDEENNKETKLSAETKGEAPSRVVIMDKEENEEGAETKQTRTNETRGVETEVNDVINEENREIKISAETKSEAPSTIVMNKEENEEEAEIKQARTNETRGVETEVNDMIDEENNNKETKISAETKSEAPSRVVTDKKENEEGAETINLSARASDEAEALSKSSEGFSKVQAETEPNFS
ncbi:hypothetical protein N665_0095s0086 [Sinapis alba]|nr:hypothetical protein N665_0095s0086 [Sinapis alba]